MKAIKGTYQYKESGLDNVYLVNGYEYAEGQGGNRAVIIHDIDGLHEVIGRYLVKERKTLAGEEIRFLRHELGMSQNVLAHLLDVTEQTVRRWEQEKLPIPRTADAVLRSVYAEKVGGNTKVSEILRRIADIEDEFDRAAMFFEEENQEWDIVDDAA
jgi:putative transcriptional regulator